MKSIKLLLLLSFCFLASCKPSETPPDNPNYTDSPKAVEKISVRFPVPAVRPPFGPWYAAQDKEYFKKQDLDVSLNYGGKGTKPLVMVTANKDLLGIMGGPDSVLVSRGSGSKLKIVAIIHKGSNFPCVITHADSGLKKIKDLDGKKIGMYYGHISTDVLRHTFNKAGIRVNEVDVGYNYSSFLAGKLDGIWAFRTAMAVELPESGTPVNVISPSEIGVVTHGYAIFATEKTIATKPDLIEKFLRATFEGVRYTSKQPAEVTKMILTRDKTGNLKEDQVLRRVKQYNEVTSSDNPFPPGYMDHKMIADTYARLLEEKVIKEPFDVKDAYTLAFLKKIHGDKFKPEQAVKE